MAKVVNSPTRLCKISTSGPITALGGISGPVTRCKLTNAQIVAIMRSGHVVHEYNPNNRSDCKPLSLDNNCESPFMEKPVIAPKKGTKSEKEPVAKKPVTAVEVPAEVPVKPSIAEEKKEKESETIPQEEASDGDIMDGISLDNDPSVEDVNVENTAEESTGDTIPADDTVNTETKEVAPAKKGMEIDVTTSASSTTSAAKPTGGSKKNKKPSTKK